MGNEHVSPSKGRNWLDAAEQPKECSTDIWMRNSVVQPRVWRSPIHGAQAPRLAFFPVNFTPAALARPAHPPPWNLACTPSKFGSKDSKSYAMYFPSPAASGPWDSSRQQKLNRLTFVDVLHRSGVSVWLSSGTLQSTYRLFKLAAEPADLQNSNCNEISNLCFSNGMMYTAS
eukprot:1157682-Pelagomonas_calceolata.AAC.2